MSSESARSGIPAYERIKRELREQIAQGGHAIDVPFITQREICERYGVGVATAVRALNELVAEGILVRRRGRGTFIADRPVPAPRAAQDGSIAFIVHGIGPHRSEIQRGVATVAAEAGYRLYLDDTSASDAEEERALKQALAGPVSGVVLYPREGDGHPAVLTELRRRGIPVVLVDRYLPGCPTDAVLLDNFTLGYELTRELLARGHRRIATLWMETRVTGVHDRLVGHVQALREHGVPVRPDFTSLRPYFGLPEAGRAALLKSLLESAEPPTALACANGPVLATAISDLLGLGVRIPQDIDVAGMDDLGPFDMLPIACVVGVLPSYKMGVQAMRMLAERIADGEPEARPHHEILPVELRTRTQLHVRLTSGPAE